MSSDGALDVTVGLGHDSYGKSSGQLELRSLRPHANLSTPSELAYHTSAASEVLRGTNGVLRQVRNSQGLIDIVVITNTEYQVRVYTSANAGVKDTPGFYAPTGTPFKTITAANPDTSGTSFNQLQVTESGEDTARVHHFTWSDEDQSWTLTSGNELRQESHISAWDASHANRTEVHTIADGDGRTLAYREQRTIHVFPWGEEVVAKVVDPDGLALTTTWSYYDDPGNDGDNYSHLKQVVEPSGRWERYQYDSLGRAIETDQQYLDAPVGAPNDQCRVTTTIYSTNDPAVTMIETIQSQEVSRRYVVYRPGETREIQAVTPNAAWDDPLNLVTITRSYLGGPFEGKTQSVARPDGTMIVYSYEYAASGDGSNLVTTVSTGQPNADGTEIVNGTRTVTAQNQWGTTIRAESHNITEGSDTLLAWNQAAAVDDFGRATEVAYSDGTHATTLYGCCGILSRTDREGIETTYSYDALQRVISTTRAGITASNSYDAAGNVLSITRIGGDGSAITAISSTYDLAGRLRFSTDALTHTTSYFEFMDAISGHWIKSNVFADGSCQVEAYYQDGQLLSETGTAVHGVRYVYGADAEGQFTQEIKLRADGSDSGEWTKTYTDFAGRPSTIVYSDGASSHSYYNSKGQLAEQVDPDGVKTLFSYNAKGELETTAIDMDQNDQIDFDGADRITQTENAVLLAHGTTVQRKTTMLFTTEDTQDATEALVNDVSADGLQSWSTSYGLTNHVQTVYSGNGRRTVTATAPDGTQQISVYENGHLMSASTVNPVLGTLNSQTYQYDSMGRLSLVAQASLPVAVTNAYAYDPADQLIAVTNAVGTAYQQVTTYQHDSMNRQSLATLPDSGSVVTEYFDTGELKKTYGACTYPVAYTYDYSGRMNTMTTWRDFAGNDGTATTTWNYDPQRGFLTSKVYDDSSSVTYNNSPAGRLLSRRWARGITTSYGYDNAGEVQTIAYSDGTPPVATVYDRQGRKTSITGSDGTHSLTYNDAGQILTESFPDSVVVSNSYDSLLRRSSLSVVNGGSQLSAIGYQYDAASRLQTVSDGMHGATYAYLPGSSLVSSIVFQTGGATKMTTTKSYDNLNRLIDIRTIDAQYSTLNAHTYTYNSANQRTRVDLADGCYWLYQYDPLGQVTSGKKYWPDGAEVAGQQFEYDFDDIGNRRSTVNGGPGSASTYSVNNLNQYTQRTVPGSVWELGSAASNATVTVNLQPANRRGEYFSKEFSVANFTGAIYTQLTTVAVLKNSGGDTNQPDIVSASSGRAFVAQSPELFGYDADGNLTNDGRWVYSWDAENRLIAVETAVPAVAAGVPRQKLEFAYDWRSRRIQKKVYDWNASSNQYQVSSNLNFIYDDWNLVAELDARDAPSAPTLLRSYMWGLNLSGTEQRAGGVGGLLFIRNRSPVIGDYAAAYDGSGNLASLVDMTSGAPAGAYEYGPSGETICVTRPMAKANPFRFSTKYQDDETTLLYYGHRFLGNARWLSRDPDELNRMDGDLYVFVRNNALSTYDVLGLWNSDVHRDRTRDWADDLHFSDEAASAIGDWDNRVDIDFDPAVINNINWSWHFDRSNGGNDTRLAHSESELRQAKRSCDWKSHGMDTPETAAMQLGRALHPLQDWVAHGDFNRRLETPTLSGVGFPEIRHYWHNWDSQVTGSAGQPDDAALDSDGPDGRSVAWVMRPGTTLSNGDHTLWASFHPGNLRIHQTEQLTKAMLSDFQEFVRSQGRPCGECWKAFLETP